MRFPSESAGIVNSTSWPSSRRLKPFRATRVELKNVSRRPGDLIKPNPLSASMRTILPTKTSRFGSSVSRSRNARRAVGVFIHAFFAEARGSVNACQRDRFSTSRQSRPGSKNRHAAGCVLLARGPAWQLPQLIGDHSEDVMNQQAIHQARERLKYSTYPGIQSPQLSPQAASPGSRQNG